MKKYLPLILLVFLSLKQIVFAQDIYNVVFMVAPFAGELNGAPMPDYKYGRMVSGDQIILDLRVMVVTVTVEEYGQHLAFSFDKPLEMAADGTRAEVQKVILEEDQRVCLRTPTIDDGADIEITWNRYQTSPVYRDFIRSITGILNGEPDERYAPYEDYSVMFDVQSAWQEGKTLGYTFRDVDGNNVDELLFGEMIEDMTGTPLYDMYTIQNGELVHVFDGWDRNRYYLSQSGVFIQQGSDSAFHSFMSYYAYGNGNLRLMRSVIYDWNRNSSSPWFLSYTDDMDSASATPISKDEAQAIMSYYIGRDVNLTRFMK